MKRKIGSTLVGSITAMLLLLGGLFEAPYGERKVLLVALSVSMLAVYGAGIIMKKNKVRTLSVHLLMLCLLMLIEYNAQYAVNYFYHAIYIVLIVYSIFYVEYRYSIGISILITGVSFVKFIQVMWIQPSFANMATLVFFVSVQLLVLIVGIFLKVYQRETKRTKALYTELLSSHKQLSSYASEIMELTRVESSNKIARDLHDTLGHDLTGLIMQMEIADGAFSSGRVDEGRELLAKSKTSARESLRKVRGIVEALKDNEVPVQLDSLEAMVNNFEEKTRCRVNLIIRGEAKKYNQDQRLVLYRIVQESLTNAVRHGHAHRVDVTVLYGSDGINFEIGNDGAVATTLKEGNGIQGMRERLKEVGGNLEISSTPQFRLWGNIPG